MHKLLAVLSILALSSAQAALEIPVVRNYDLADSKELWAKSKTDQIPQSLLKDEVIENPTKSYSALFPKSFFQEEIFTICYQNCTNSDSFNVKNGSVGSLSFRNWNKSEVVEQSTVYFWLNKYFRFLDEKLYFRPNQFLRIFTNREVKDEINGKAMKNNAFFNPRDVTLSFLPATNNLLFKLTGGKINRSGFDPSVVIHEASHYFFHHLFPNPVNSEIGGLNEGFADYVANIVLNNPKLGLVMLHGETLRDSSTLVDKNGKPKTYEPKMEVHDLGERISLALWKSRELSDDKNEMDRLVIDAVAQLGQNPYSTIHDFKALMLERIKTVIPAQNLSLAEATWEMIFPGQRTTIENFKFLKKSINSKSFIGFNVKQSYGKEFARDMGIETEEKFNLNIIKMEQISDTQSAILVANETETLTTPYWVIMDTVRSNILGIYSINGELITNSEELKSIEQLVSQMSNGGAFISDFLEKVKSFTELHSGKGEFALMYRTSRKDPTQELVRFNGVKVPALRHKIELKRRMIIGRLLGLPEISSVSLITVPSNTTEAVLPEISGGKVIGYQIAFKTGTSTEVILNKFREK